MQESRFFTLGTLKAEGAREGSNWRPIRPLFTLPQGAPLPTMDRTLRSPRGRKDTR